MQQTINYLHNVNLYEKNIHSNVVSLLLSYFKEEMCFYLHLDCRFRTLFFCAE